jgi:uncharacterized protein (UPF0332 family)
VPDPDSSNEKKKSTLAAYRLERARELLDASQLLLDAEHVKDSINRSYYAMLSALKSVLALDGFDAKKHYGVISEFRKLYIKTGTFDEEFSDYIGDAFQVRNSSDYNDMFLVSKDEALEQLEHAKKLVDAVNAFLSR